MTIPTAKPDGMKVENDLVTRRTAVTPQGIPMVTPMVIASATDAILTGVDGKEIIDFAG